MGRRASNGATVRLKHVHRFTDRHGRVRHYLRLPGAAAISLPGEPGSPAFMAAYQEAVALYAPAEASKSKAAPGSMRDLAERYFQSGRFKNKSERTRYVERRTLERFLATHGDKSAIKVEARHLDAILATMVGTPAAAMDMRKRLRNLFRLAIKLGWRTDDPVRETDTFKLGTWHTWTDDEIRAFQDRWPRETRQRLAFDLLLYSGQRSGDVRRFTWADIRDGVIRVTQEKTGAELAIPVHADLQTTLDIHRRDVGAIVVTEFGKPFSQAGFGNWMADSIKRASLPDQCVTHGLRKAAARLLAEAGCTAHQIRAITGHKSLKEVQRYTDAASQADLAQQAMERVSGGKHGTSILQT